MVRGKNQILVEHIAIHILLIERVVDSSIISVFAVHFLWIAKIQFENILLFEYNFQTDNRARKWTH
jgi:hypothetical protein